MVKKKIDPTIHPLSPLSLLFPFLFFYTLGTDIAAPQSSFSPRRAPGASAHMPAGGPPPTPSSQDAFLRYQDASSQTGGHRAVVVVVVAAVEAG